MRASEQRLDRRERPGPPTASGKEKTMRQDTGAREVRKEGEDMPVSGVNLAFAECNGVCWECRYAVARQVRGAAGGVRYTCTAGRMNLRTDRPPDNLYGVREADALGQAAEFGRAQKGRR